MSPRETILQALVAILSKIPHEKILPSVLMTIDFFAALPYIMKGDLRMSVYWIAAGVLTLSVTWL